MRPKPASNTCDKEKDVVVLMMKAMATLMVCQFKTFSSPTGFLHGALAHTTHSAFGP